LVDDADWRKADDFDEICDWVGDYFGFNGCRVSSVLSGCIVEQILLDGPRLACCRALRRLANGSYAKQAQKSGDITYQESWDIRIKSVSREKPGVQRQHSSLPQRKDRQQY
jgi:hypothetical protein